MSRRCLGCMELFGDEFQICPHCGHIVGTPAEEAIHMEPGTLLYDRYIVGKVLGYGGFGVTYIGWDGKLEQKVAIKEYLPGEFSTRMPGQSQVTVFNGEKNEQFHDGLKKFIEEARHLAKFQNEEGIVKIFDSFEENDTAYIIMEYLDGETLTSYLKREKTIPEDKAVEMLMPIMESLQTVHAEGILHRDIAPDNIFLLKSGEVKLIDFGASRYATTSHSRSLTVIVKPGYSPEEQYRSRGDQGPHTDVYAIAATLYKMITGKTPPDAMERRAKYENQSKDILEAPHKIEKNISVNREIAILNAMNVRVEDRTPDVATFIKELNADPPAKRIYGKIKKIDLYAWPLWLKIAIPALLACVIAFVTLLLTGVINFSRFTEEIVIPEGIVTVPDVEGELKDDAIKTIEDAKLLATTGGTIESEYIQAGKIILQSPVGGSYMDINGTVVLTISSGKEVEESHDGISTVPYVIWDQKEDAVAKLKKAGLGEPIIEEINDENVAPGQVISQSIEAGEKVDEGTVITLQVSLGGAAFDMPSVEGKLFTEAEKTLSDRGLVVTIEYKKDNSVPDNCVITQSVKAGMSVKRGDKIILTVSSGKNTISVANVVGKDKGEATEILKKQNFKVAVLENYDASVPTGKVISQSPTEGTSQIEGSSITIYVSKGKQPVKVSLDANGGSVSNSYVMLYYKGTYGSLPDASRTGYTFNGWFTSAKGGTKITSNNEVTSPSEHTLYAQWTPKSYTVTFDAQGGKVSASNKNVTYGSSYGELPTPTRTGYGFDGWFTQKSGGDKINSGSKVSITAAQTLYAHWTAGKITITFNANGGTSPESSCSVTYNGTYGTLPNPTRPGYNFTGWFTSASGGSKVNSSSKVTNSNSHTLYAQWKIATFTISFDPNNGSVDQKTKTVTYNSTYGTLPTPTRPGYRFKFWYTDPQAGEKITEKTVVSITENVTLYAHWTKETYTVTFNSNGQNYATQSVTYKSMYGSFPPNPSKTGSTFTGWFTAQSGGTRVYEDDKYTLTTNQTLYAHWSTNSYTLYFNANGGSVSTSSKTLTYGSTYGSLPTPSRDYYTFAGWYTASSGGSQVNSNTTITGNTTIYAHWSTNSYTLYFNANGGSVSTSSKTLTYGSTYGSLPTPSRDYYTFAGWYTASSGGSQVNSNTTITGNTTIYAHWSENATIGPVQGSLPSGAKLVSEYWTYTRTQTKESSNSSESGWTQTGSYWNKTGSGSTNYATFPSGFDTQNTYYTSFAKSAYTSSETATTKREVSNSWTGYIYWHWMYNVSYGTGTGRTIADKYCYYDNKAFYYFYAIASSTNCPTLGIGYVANYAPSKAPTTYNCVSIIPSGYGSPTDGRGTPRMLRFDYYTSNYTDYRKVFKYQKVTNETSYSAVYNGGEISNVQHYISYIPK